MKALFALTTLLFAPQLFATELHMEASTKTTSVYRSLSDTRYQGVSISGNVHARIYGNVNGQDINISKDEPAQIANVQNMKFDIVDSKHVRLYASEGDRTMIFMATFSQDGSFVIKGSDMKKYLNTEAKKKMQEMSASIPGELSTHFETTDMICKKRSNEYSCKTSMVLKIGMVQE